MILQKLASAIRRQDWFTVTLEVLIVVVGLFVGLQVDDWNQQRKDRVLEQEYLERLLADMNGSIEDFGKYSAWDLGRLRSQHLVLESLRTGRLAAGDEAEFQVGLAMLGYLNPQRRRWGTVDELIATGNIALIRDQALRAEILATDAYFQRNGKVIDASEGRIIELLDRTSGRFDVLSFYMGFPSGAAKVEYDFDALSADTEFIALVSNIQVASHTIFEFALDSAGSMERLRDRIAAEIGVPTAGLPTVDVSYEDFPWRLAPDSPAESGEN